MDDNAVDAFANCALTVGADIDYIKVRMTTGSFAGEIFYLAKDAALRVLKDEYEVLAEMKGKELEFDEYERLIWLVNLIKKRGM